MTSTKIAANAGAIPTVTALTSTSALPKTSPPATSTPIPATITTTSIAPEAFRILLVDDNADANESMAALLELLGFNVRTASDGATALAANTSFAPHLIFCDIGLPGMNGYELAGALRSAVGRRHVVLVAATGYGHESGRARSRAAGSDHHLVKPLDADVLLDFVAAQAANWPTQVDG